MTPPLNASYWLVRLPDLSQLVASGLSSVGAAPPRPLLFLFPPPTTPRSPLPLGPPLAGADVASLTCACLPNAIGNPNSSMVDTVKQPISPGSGFRRESSGCSRLFPITLIPPCTTYSCTTTPCLRIQSKSLSPPGCLTRCCRQSRTPRAKSRDGGGCLTDTLQRAQMVSSEYVAEGGLTSRYLEPSSFIDAVAPTEEGFNRISRQQYSICEWCARAL